MSFKPWIFKEPLYVNKFGMLEPKKSSKNIIPDHLGERWDNMSIEEAQKEWKELYRKTSRFQKF